jgi:flagellar motor switch/type III secretory pathway protein FliN
MAEALAAAPLRDGFKVYGWLPCSITLEIPVTRFSVRELLNLQVGDIVETSTPQAIDLPLRCNGEVIGFAEFDVIGNTLAVRITELA